MSLSLDPIIDPADPATPEPGFFSRLWARLPWSGKKVETPSTSPAAPGEVPTELLEELWDLVQALWATPNRWLRWLIVGAVATPFLSMLTGMFFGQFAMVTALIPVLIVVWWATIRIDPLVIGVLNQRPWGKKVTGWVIFVSGIELAWGFFCGIFPLGNNLRVSFTALFVLIAAAAVAGGASYLELKSKWPKKLAKFLVFVAVICGVVLVSTEWKTVKAESVKVFNTFTESDGATGATGAPEFPLPTSTCDGMTNTFFAPEIGTTKVKIPQSVGCWTGWTTTPADWPYWNFSWTGPGGMWIQFLNKKPEWLPAGSVNPKGKWRGIFRTSGRGHVYSWISR